MARAKRKYSYFDAQKKDEKIEELERKANILRAAFADIKINLGLKVQTVVEAANGAITENQLRYWLKLKTTDPINAR
jgi:hypothetical protein